MKKIVLLIALILVSSLVLAEGPNRTNRTGQGVQAENRSQEGVPTLYQEGEQAGAKNREGLQQGLTNALTRVKNENARQRLQQNIEKFMQKYQERMQRMEGLNITGIDNETGAVQLRAKEEVRFFGFIKGKATKRFEINNKGNITEKHPWYKFLYREAESE
jgi:hypothetical protein